MQQSDEEAERWWLRAGEGRVQRAEGESDEEGGEEDSVVRAQNTLGMFYSQQESLNIKKVFLITTACSLLVSILNTSHQSIHWHSRAAENGHLESMGELTNTYCHIV